MDFSNKTYRDHLILSSPEKMVWGMICCIIQAQTILLERGWGGFTPRKILFELIQNPAILEGTLACYHVTIRVETAHFD